MTKFDTKELETDTLNVFVDNDYNSDGDFVMTQVIKKDLVNKISIIRNSKVGSPELDKDLMYICASSAVSHFCISRKSIPGLLEACVASVELICTQINAIKDKMMESIVAQEAEKY